MISQDYDWESDTLYVSFGSPEPTYTEPVGESLSLLLERECGVDRVKGFQVHGFRELNGDIRHSHEGHVIVVNLTLRGGSPAKTVEIEGRSAVLTLDADGRPISFQVVRSA